MESNSRAPICKVICECGFIERFKIRTDAVQARMLSSCHHFCIFCIITLLHFNFMSILWAESFKFSASLKSDDVNRLVSVVVESLTWNCHIVNVHTPVN